MIYISFKINKSFHYYWRSNTPNNLFHFEEVSENFTLGQLKKLKSKKAVGLDAIPTRLLKDLAKIIANPLTKIINFSLANGCVPSEWKEARVIPLFKSRKSHNMDNYRPVSILPVVSKILERAVHTQLYKFMVDNNLLSPYQSGFRKRHSTETACISLLIVFDVAWTRVCLQGLCLLIFARPSIRSTMICFWKNCMVMGLQVVNWIGLRTTY